VRKLLSDFSIIGRDLLARGASKAAEGLSLCTMLEKQNTDPWTAVRPEPERLVRVDDTAPQDQFITEESRTVETPVLEASVPGTDKTVSQHPRDDLGKGKDVNGVVTNGGDVHEEAEARLRQVKEEIQDVQNGTTNGEKKDGFMKRMRVCFVVVFDIVMTR
jgi:hypothetical protein